ncbi:hypothetical protein HT031_000562 [Scenedesmus sp. PABB004]|nr:hypothetical protein HT031_000562 [Scenedesmus sp. PABB004]
MRRSAVLLLAFVVLAGVQVRARAAALAGAGALAGAQPGRGAAAPRRPPRARPPRARPRPGRARALRRPRPTPRRAAPPRSAQAAPKQGTDPLEGLAPPPAALPPGLETLNLTQLAPMLPLLSNINADIVASWIPVLEQVDASRLGKWGPVLNAINASTVEALMAALPFLDPLSMFDLIPVVNAIPSKTLAQWIVIASKLNATMVKGLVPAINSLDPAWVNKVVPALAAFDPDYLVKLANAIAPPLQKINPDLIVSVLPAMTTISTSTWEKLIELLNKLTAAQLDFLVHLLDVTGPYLDKMVRVLNFVRGALPFDVSTVAGRTTVFTKAPGTVGMSDSSKVLATKGHVTSEPNNGAPPAPSAPAVVVENIPKTMKEANAILAKREAAAKPAGRRFLH